MDEHVAPKIVSLVKDLALSDACEVSSVRDAGHVGTSDVHWITQFAREGGDAIISADTDFFKKPPQVEAVFQTGMKVIHLPSKWSNAKGHLQAAHILQWWHSIEAQIALMDKRECYQVPWNIKPNGNLKKKKIDFANAQKKLRRSKRRSR